MTNRAGLGKVPPPPPDREGARGRETPLGGRAAVSKVFEILKLTSFSPKVRYTILGIGAFFVVGGGVSAYATFDYTQNNPRFCTSCHIMDDAFQRWSKSEHSKESCHACHPADLGANLRQLYVYATNPPDKPRHGAEVENHVCFNCHRVDGDEEAKIPAEEKWKDVLAESGHTEHVKKQKIQCVRCHSTSLHSFSPPEDLCTSCHKHTKMVGNSMDAHCTSCHAFTATERKSLLPARSDCLTCHADMQVHAEVFPEAEKKTDSPMQWECGRCHKPHTQMALAYRDCEGCHADAIAKSDIHKVKAHYQCMGCHKPHLWKVTTQEPCLVCHKGKEKHADGEVCASCHE